MTLSGCAFHKEAASNSNQIQTSVVLQKNNFKVVKQVEGECKQVYVFGIGGANVGESAMSEMIRSARLSGSQAIINTNVAYSKRQVFMITIIKATATGTVIEFTE